MCGSLYAFIAASLLVGCSTKRHIVDLTHRLGNNYSVTYPGYPGFNHTVLIKGKQPTGVWMLSGWFSIAEHAGTHIDAPAHFASNGLRMDEVPLEELIGPGVVIDITRRATKDADAQLGLADLQEWEAKHGVIPKGAFVLMNSGWAQKYPNKTKIFGTPYNNDLYSTKYHHPGFTPEASRWLVERRDIKGLGVDSPSPDFGQAQYEYVHEVVQGAGKVILENVANLDNVPEAGATIYAIPTKLEGGSGAPVRLFAILDDASGVVNVAIERCVCVTHFAILITLQFIVGVLFL